MSVSNSSLCTAAALLGVISHLGWFIHGEHDFYARTYAVLFFSAPAGAFFALARLLGQSFGSSLLTVALVFSSFYGALFTSIIVYRLFLHRLRKFPGPLTWKLSKITHMLANGDAKGYLHIDELHKRYGKFVRIGPNELSIVDPSAARLVLGPGSRCTKAIWYDVGKPMISMHQVRDKHLHDKRRRTWDKGFNAKALREYEPRVLKYTNMLLNQVKAFGGGKFNASKWFNYYSFDVMGDMAFAESFHMLESGEQHFAIPLLEAGMKSMNIIPVLPWLFWIMTALPFLTAEYAKFIAWSGDQATKRKSMKVTTPDIMSHLLAAEPANSDPEVNRHWEVGDSRLIIVAGSDTTAATLTYSTYELIKNPKVLGALREEIAPYYNGGEIDYSELQKCQHLNAVIDETLRLHPPVPSGLIRITPPEGLTVDGTYIPGDTTITLPCYTAHRSPEAWARPDEFIPERWYSLPELIKDKGAYFPFSLGAMSCVGKGLALMETRMVIAKLVMEYDFDFASNEDGSALINDTEDRFTLNLADMFLTVKPRNA